MKTRFPPKWGVYRWAGPGLEKERLVGGLDRLADAEAEAHRLRKAGTSCYTEEDRTPILRARKTFLLTDLVRPDAHHFGFPDVGGLQIALEFFRWCVLWGDQVHGLRELLSMQPTCRGFWWVHGFTGYHWTRDLRDRFQYLLLYDPVFPEIAAWKAVHGLEIGRKKTLPLGHYDPPVRMGNASLEDVLTCLLTLRGDALAVSHNSHHLEAKTVHGVSLHAGERGWYFKLGYGYPLPDSSSWYLYVHSEPGERLADFVVRAFQEIQTWLVEPLNPCAYRPNPEEQWPYRGDRHA